MLANLSEPPNVPGDSFYYSNTGYDLLGVVIERASRQSFPDFMHAHIFSPLGMKSSFSLPNPVRRAGPLVSVGYTGDSANPQPYLSDDLDNLYGSGSIYTTIGDMALYDRALYNATLVSDATLAEAFQPVMLSDGRSEPYGFGWEVKEFNGVPYVAHSGTWLGFNADYVRILGQHLSVIVLLNRDYEYPDDPRIALRVAQSYLSVAEGYNGEDTAIAENRAVPDAFGWMVNYPNPFNATTVIDFNLIQAQSVTLDIYDIKGRLVRRLWDGPLSAGAHHVRWDGFDERGVSVATGIYLGWLRSAERDSGSENAAAALSIDLSNYRECPMAPVRFRSLAGAVCLIAHPSASVTEASRVWSIPVVGTHQAERLPVEFESEARCVWQGNIAVFRQRFVGEYAAKVGFNGVALLAHHHELGEVN